MTTLYINGKFTAQNMTGVQRAAHELVLAIDRRLAAAPPQERMRVELLCPPAGRQPLLGAVQARTIGPQRGSLAAWEQSALPWAARSGWLLNLAGSAPWWWLSHTVCTLHDAAVFDRPEAYTRAFGTWYRALFRHLARRADGLVTVSAFSHRRLVEQLGCAPQRIRVVHNGADHFARVSADPSVLKAHGLQPGRFLLLVGTAKSTKNAAAVLQAWRGLPDRDGRTLVWVGGVNRRVFTDPTTFVGMERAELRQNAILRLGVIPDARLKTLYENAAGVIVASTYEGFGFPAVEAMSCGCPVAAAAAASLPEVCGDAALYFDAHSPDSIAQAMTSLLHDEPLRRDFGRRGQAHVAALSWDAAAGELLDYLGDLGLPRH